MKKMKRLISVLLAFAMALSLAVPVAFATDFTDVPSDYRYADAIQSLVIRGIINGYEQEDGTFQFMPESTITRAEFSKMVVSSLGMGEVAAMPVADSGFPDVASGENGHWAAGYIRSAYDMKIINGFDDGTFKPEENVTYEQAVKMIVCAKSEVLGELAMKNGGYPVGYMKVATSYGFTKNIVDGIQTQPAKRGTIAKLMDNMIKSDLSNVIDGPNINAGSDTMEEEKVQIIATYSASLDGSSVARNVIKVRYSDDETALFSIADLKNKDKVASYIGKMVTIYYEEDESEEIQILSDLSPVKNKNAETEVSFDELAGNYTNTNVPYYDADGDAAKVSVDSDAVIMFNGGLVDDTLKNILDTYGDNAGYIRFLAPDGGNSDAEVVFITVYENYFVTSITASSKTVYTESGDSFVVDPDSRSKFVTILKDGKSAEFEEIKKNQILTVSESLDGKYMEVLISTEAPSGKVTAVNSDEGILSLDKKEYKLSSGVSLGADVSVGATLQLYLDAFGKIAKYTYKVSAVNYVYGYLLDIENFGTGFDPDVRIVLLNMNLSTTEEPMEYKLADTVRINNVPYSTATAYEDIEIALEDSASLLDYAPDYVAAAGEVYQPIKFTLANGKVNSILTAKDGVVTDADLKVDAYALEGEGAKCTTRHTTLDGIYVMNSATKVLYVPEDRSDNTAYTIKRGNTSGMTAGNWYRTILVDTSKSNIPAMVVVYGDAPDATSEEWNATQPVMVTYKTEDGKGNRIDVQTFTGGKASYYDEATSFYNQVSKGDIVRIIADDDKMIKKMEVVLDVSEAYVGDEFVRISTRQETDANIFPGDSGTTRRLREGDNKTEDRATMSLVAGTAYNLEDNTLMVALEYLESGESFVQTELGREEKMQTLTLDGNTKVVAVNFKADESVKDIEQVEIGQVATYSRTASDANKVFIYRYMDTIRWVVILRPAQ